MIFTNLHLNSIGVQKTPMLFFFIILILFNSPIYSQDCNSSLTLKIIDLHDSSVLQNASIFIKELDKKVITNSNDSKKTTLVFYKDLEFKSNTKLQ